MEGGGDVGNGQSLEMAEREGGSLHGGELGHAALAESVSFAVEKQVLGTWMIVYRFERNTRLKWVVGERASRESNIAGLALDEIEGGVHSNAINPCRERAVLLKGHKPVIGA